MPLGKNPRFVPRETLDVPLIATLRFVPIRVLPASLLQADDPSPAELSARAAEVRAGWSAKREREAEGALGSVPVSISVCDTTAIPSSSRVFLG